MGDAPPVTATATGAGAARVRPAAVGVDLGGTNLRVALVAADGTVLGQRRAPSRGDVLAAIDAAVADLGAAPATGAPPLPLGIGVASIVRDNRVAVFGPNLAIGTVDLVERFGLDGGRVVVVENDANAATHGEWRVGAGRGHDHLLMVTLGTGVGGGAVVDGRLLRGASGFAGEAGHVPLVSGGRRCACGRRGCLEAYASGGALAVEAAERLAAGGASPLAELGERLDGRAVSEAAAAGDALAIAAVEQVGRWLGEGLVGMVNLLDPSLVLVGGGVADAVVDWVLPQVRAVLASEVEGHGHRPPPEVALASLRDDAGIVGAALLALAEAESRGEPDDHSDVHPEGPST